MKARTYVLEKQQETLDSQREARGLFLALIPDLAPTGTAPQVITDLWPVFWYFLFAVAARFKHDLLPDSTSSASSGEQVFAAICARAIKKQKPEFWLNNGLGAILTIAFGHVRQKLQPTFATNRTHVIDPVKRNFQNGKKLLRRKEAKHLREKLNEWSTKWNLDAEWCRDHALNVFRDLLFDDTIQWGFLYPDPGPFHCSPARAARLVAFWHFEAKHTTGDVSVSRFILASQVYDGGDEPESFVFRWREFNFEVPAWRYLRDQQAEYQRQVRLDFRIHCHRAELERLESLKRQEAQANEELENKLVGVLTKFDRELDKHTRKMAKRKSAAESKHNLVAVRKRNKLLQHLKWSVRYQVYGENLADMAESHGVKLNTVSEAVNDLLNDMNLPKRPPSSRGRPQGSKNKESAKTREILRALGR